MSEIVELICAIIWRGMVILLILAILWVAFHVLHAEATRNNPPSICLLVGGHWDIYNGWQCG